MSHVLVMTEHSISADERPTYFRALEQRRIKAKELDVHFWVFEQTDVSGRFVEFVEASSRDALHHALQSLAPHALHSAVWREAGDA